MSGSQDWTAFFFGSSDPGNSITVDKPPLSLWIMSLSVRLFGLSSWSILVPQAVMGVLTVFLVYSLVRKYFDPATALLAGFFMSVTPVATVMFRYNNPDGLLTLIMVGIAYSVLEAIRRERIAWLLLAGALTGAGFLTKQLQVVLVLPAVGLAYLLFARASPLNRVMHLMAAALTAAVAGGWWFVAVQLISPADRPFIGGTRQNNVIELTLGYNGLDRLTGEDATRTMSGSAVAAAEKLDPGFQRFLQPQFSGQFGWFLPLAIAGLCVAVWYIWRGRGSPAKRAFLLLCSTWFLCAASVLAFMSGIVHPYYALTAVPALCCLAAVGLGYLLRNISRWRVKSAMGLTLIATLVLAFISAARSTADFPDLPQVLAVVGAVVIALQLVPTPSLRIRIASGSILIAALGAGPGMWSVNTVLSPHVGAGVVAGPSILGIRTDHPDRKQLVPGMPPSFTAVMFGDVPAQSVLERLRHAQPSATWAAAVVGSETAANYQLESGRAVLPIGGFDGTDPYPTLAQFQDMVLHRRVGAVVIQNLPPLTLEGRGESAKIVEWVKANYPAEIVDGAEYYGLVP
ncbi:ArnT family glycosyltransferase [Pseudarthrobacter sp. N5]|uniref:ArnT family glycosyltransferase n=1 Tax=Pseudarthrobacter sp. N5 TaxID=3418416 RepID=UPI003CF4B2D2